jgi:hypothetical protein
VLRFGLVCLSARVMKFNSNSKVLNLLHQMWFIPLLFRVKLTREGLNAAKGGVKSTDLRWIEKMTWVWVVRYNKGQESYLFSGNQQNAIAGVLIIFALILLL